MILSAEYSHGQEKMGTASMLPASVLHSSRHGLYPGYLMESSWHHPIPLKQEPEDASNNNDSGISPSHYSDGSVQNTSPQSCLSEDSGMERERGRDQTNATLGVLARPIMEAPESPRPLPVPRSPQPSPRLSPQQSASPRTSTSPQPSCSFTAAGSLHSPLPQPLKDESRSPSSSTDTEYYEDPLRGLQMAMQRRGMMGPVQPEPPVNGEKPLQCPLCPFSTTIRSAFNNHLMSEHSEQASCHLCEHTAENHCKLKEHLQAEHNVQLGPDEELGSWGEEEEPGVSTPRVNSQGKVKTYRCKQCEFSTVTKLEFWEHTRGHIKPERLLTCPKCPFVTEYKHHLEYHLRNHFGSKPFKCDKCSYSCVNKSMLNSHLKSHSNVYQFRCADCAYATKYCHSLKLHLRKYGHNPAMVLNPDGSPNPLPIVDVYGTRRGPKRPKKPEDIPTSQQTPLPSLPSVFSNPYGFLSTQAIPYPYNALMNTFHRNPLLPFPNNNPMTDRPGPPQAEQESSLFNAAVNMVQQSGINVNQEAMNEYLPRVIPSQETITRPSEEDPTRVSGAPLDLSRSDPEPQEPSMESPSDQAIVDPSTSKEGSKNRRKGKAFKLERIAQRLQQHSSDEEGEASPMKRPRLESPGQERAEEAGPERAEGAGGVEPSTSKGVHEPGTPGEAEVRMPEGGRERWDERRKEGKEVYDCPYCDMLFGNLIMYTMHMGYHGYRNPFTCNSCGEQTSGSLEFFLHLLRYPHA